MYEKPHIHRSTNSFSPDGPRRTVTPLTQEQPSKPPGERLASYFENFFKTIVGIATLGASLTFNKIVSFSTPASPELPSKFATSPARLLTLLSISWLFFVLALAFTSFFASALSLWRPAAVKAFGTEDTEDRIKVLWFASGVSAFLLALIVVAFLTLSLVVAGYVGAVGWVAVAFTGLFGVLCIGVIIWRSPLQRPAWVHRRRRRGNEGGEGNLQFGKVRGPRGGDHGNNAAMYGMEDGDDRVDSPDASRYQSSPARGQPKPRRTARIDETSIDNNRAGFDTYGRSTSGDYRGPSAGNAALRHSSGAGRAELGGGGGFDYSRYSRASTVIPDAYEPGRYGSAGYMYDDGVREGLVMSQYDR